MHKLHKPYQIPKAMSAQDIADTIQHFQTAARNAVLAGFDGIELHAAHGYLIDQFINEKTNHRTDEYGGDTAGRLRFLRDIILAVKKEISVDRISVRFSEKKDDDVSYASGDKAGMIDAYLKLFRETGITIYIPQQIIMRKRGQGSSPFTSGFEVSGKESSLVWGIWIFRPQSTRLVREA